MVKNIFFLLVAVVVITLVVGVVFLFTRKQPLLEETQRSRAPVQAPEEGLGGQLYKNPSEVLPETNPFGQARTNPFEGYTNPFE